MSKSNMVAASIKNLRKQKGLTQDQLAEALHVTRQAVSNWENGKTEPDIETITQLAEFFEVDAETIIYGKTSRVSITNTSQGTAQGAVTLGTVIAVVISYAKWQSIGWAIFHGLLSWVYVIYYVIKY